MKKDEDEDILYTMFAVIIFLTLYGYFVYGF